MKKIASIKLGYIKISRNLWKVFFLFFLLPLIFQCSNANNKTLPKIEKGILDLSATQWNGEPLALDGEWEFYWNEFLEPYLQQDTVHYIPVPRTWKGFLFGEKELEGEGYATYRLRIRNTKISQVGIKLGSVSTNYALYVNKQLVSRVGRIGKNKEEAIFAYKPQIVPLDDITGDIELTILVSNFHHDKGGLRETILFGKLENLYKIKQGNLNISFFLFGSLFIMSVYHFGLFVVRRGEKSTLYFAIFSFLFSIRPLLIDEKGVSYLLGDTIDEYLAKLDYLTITLPTPFIIFFLQSNFLNEFNKRMSMLIFYGFLVLSGIVIFFPIKVFSGILYLNHLLIIISILYVLFSILKAIRKKREGSFAFMVGSLFLITCIIHDILVAQEVFQSSLSLLSLGFLIFIFSQAYMLSAKFSKAFFQSEVSRRYAEEQKGLAQKRQVEIENLNKTKDQFLSNLSHEIRTPLTYIYLYSDLLKSQDSQETIIEYTNEILNTAKKLNELVEDLILITDIETSIQINKNEICMKWVMEEEVEKLKEIRNAKNIEIKNEISEEVFISGDPILISKLLNSILKNAILYNRDNGLIKINQRIENQYLAVSIEDTGIGIPTEFQEKIFEKFFRIDASLNYEVSGVGIGLFLVKKILELHHGYVQVKSEMGVGSEFTIYLPLIEP